MLRWTWISIVIVFLDQLTKWMAEASLEEGIPYAIMDHLNMTLAYNYGAAFSSFSGFRWGLTTLSVVVSLGIIYWIKNLKSDEVWTAVGFSLVLGGAIGNFVDRALYGKVIDFIDVYWTDVGYHFATFNVADIAISMGATLLVFISLFAKDEEQTSN